MQHTPTFLRTVACAWCAVSIEIDLLGGKRTRQPVRRVTLRCDGPDGHRDIYTEQYGCSPEHEALIRHARPVVALERGEETIIVLKVSKEVMEAKEPQNPQPQPKLPTLKEVRPDVWTHWTERTMHGGPNWAEYILFLNACNATIKDAPKTAEKCQQVDPQLLLVQGLERMAEAINRILPGGFWEFAAYLAENLRKKAR